MSQYNLKIKISPKEVSEILENHINFVYTEKYSVENVDIIALIGRQFFSLPGCHMSYVILLDNKHGETNLKLLFMQATRAPKDFTEDHTRHSDKIFDEISFLLSNHIKS